MVGLQLCALPCTAANRTLVNGLRRIRQLLGVGTCMHGLTDMLMHGGTRGQWSMQHAPASVQLLHAPDH